MKPEYRIPREKQGGEADRLRSLWRSGAVYVTRSWRGWGLAAKSRRGLALMLRGEKLPAPVYLMEKVDTGMVRHRKPELVLRLHAEMTEAETLDPGPPEVRP